MSNHKTIKELEPYISLISLLGGGSTIGVYFADPLIAVLGKPLTAIFGAILCLLLYATIKKIFFEQKEFEKNVQDNESQIASEFVETRVVYDVEIVGDGFRFSENKLNSKNIKRSIIYDKPIAINGFLFAPIVNVFDKQFPYNKVNFINCDGHGFKDISYKSLHTEVNSDLCCVFEFGELQIRAEGLKNLKRFTIEHHGK